MNCLLMFNHFAVILPCCIAGACPRGIDRLGRPSWLLCNNHVLRINREIFDSVVIVRRKLDCSKCVGPIVVLLNWIIWTWRYQSVDFYQTNKRTTMADKSKQDQDPTSTAQDLPPSTEEKPPEDLVNEKENGSEKDGSTVSTASAKIHSLCNNKKSAKTRLTKAKNQLTELLGSNTLNGALPSKNTIRRAVNKIKTELSIIEKIVASLKEVYALNEIEDADTIIEALDKEADEIMASVDKIIENAEKHVQERLDQGEEESVLLSNKSPVNDDKVSLASSYVKQKQLEAKQAGERLAQVEEEQKQKELELAKITAEVELAKQRAEEARKVAALNQQRADAAERESGVHDKDGISLSISCSPDLEYEKNAYGQYHRRLVKRSLPVKLKGVDLPKFSGEDKADYEPWRAAFMSVVDVMDIPVGEEVL